MVRSNGLFHLLVNGVYWGYNPFTNHLLTSLGHPFACVLSFINRIPGPLFRCSVGQTSVSEKFNYVLRSPNTDEL